MTNQHTLRSSLSLRSIHLQNFKCFEDQILHLRPLTLLSGLNSTGKSSALQSLLLLRQSYQQDLLLKTGLALNGDLVHIGTAMLEALALSFKSDQCWERSSLELTLIELDEQGELLRDGDVFSVNHACSIVHTQHHANWIKERIHMEAQLSILDGNDIWIQRETLFPHLQFCAAVQKQLQSMRRNDLLLQPIFKKLVAFDTLCANWHDGSFLKHNTIPHISPESDATLRKYKNEHTFVCPDGISRLFSLHARFTPHAGRIYFHVGEEKKTLTIGHIGHKLPNIQYPT